MRFLLFIFGSLLVVGMCAAGFVIALRERALEQEEEALLLEIQDFYKGYDNDYLGDWKN